MIKRWPSQEARNWTTAALERFKSDPSVMALVAVGSAVRDVDSSSDIDLVLVYSGSKPVPGTRPLDVDLRLYDCAKVDEFIASGNDYLIWALRFGIPLLQRDAFWSRLVVRWKGKSPWPDPCESERRAARAR